VVSWNAADRLPAMLAGLQEQRVECLQLVVVDNGSTDGSANLVARQWPSAVVERLATNTGFAAAANRGFRLSSGEAVALLNYDVVLRPGYFERCLAELARWPELGSVQGLLLRPGGASVDSAGHEVTRGRWFRNRGENQAPESAVFVPARVFGVTGAAAVYRRAMLLDVAAVTGHLFDPRFFAYLEDVDLDYRARWRGWESAVVDGAVGEHEHTGSGARSHLVVQRHIIKNRLLVLYRNESVRLMIADLPWVSGQLLARLALALVTAPGSLLGVLDFVRLLPSQRSARRAIRASRKTSIRAVRPWLRASRRETGGFATRTRHSAPGARPRV